MSQPSPYADIDFDYKKTLETMLVTAHDAKFGSLLDVDLDYSVFMKKKRVWVLSRIWKQ